MDSLNFTEWNSLVYLVSDIYGATKRFKVGEAGIFACQIRKSAVSLSALMNTTSPSELRKEDFSKIYPILSSIYVLETYLQLARRNRYIKNTDALEEKLNEVKDDLLKLLAQE